MTHDNSRVWMEELHDLDKNVRLRAAMALGEHCGREASASVVNEAVPSVVGALKVERDFFVREALTWALVRIGQPAVTPLIEAMGDADAGVRHHAAHALSKIGDRRAIPSLVNALRDADDLVVAKAAYGLGHLGAVEASPELISLLAHRKAEVHATAVAALERMGPAIVPALVGALMHDLDQVRELAANALGSIAERNAIPALIHALADRAWRVRVAALVALDRFDRVEGDEVTQAIAAAREDDDPRVRALVAKINARRSSSATRRSSPKFPPPRQT